MLHTNKACQNYNAFKGLQKAKRLIERLFLRSIDGFHSFGACALRQLDLRMRSGDIF